MGTLSLTVGQTHQLTVAAVDSRGLTVSTAPTFASSSPAVATVSSTGLVTAVSAGHTVVTTEAEGLADVLTVTITAASGNAAAMIADVGDAQVLGCWDFGTVPRNVGDRVYEWADVRGDGHPVLVPIDYAPVLRADGVSFNEGAAGLPDGTEALATEAAFAFDDTLTLVHVGDGQGSGILAALMSPDGSRASALSILPATKMSDGITDEIYGRSGGVYHARAESTNTNIQNGPGDRVTEPGIGVTFVTRNGATTTIEHPPTRAVTVSTVAATGPARVIVGRGASKATPAEWDRDRMRALMVVKGMTAAQKTRILQWARDAHGAHGLRAKLCIGIGDSIMNAMDGDPRNGWFPRMMASAPFATDFDWSDVGRGGKGFGTVEPNLTADVLSVLDPATYTRGVAALDLGTNDIAGIDGHYWTSQEVYDAYVRVCTALRGAGYKVAIGTILPRATASLVVPLTSDQFEVIRLDLNTKLRAGMTGTTPIADALIDFGAHPIMGQQSNLLNLTYFADGTHPSPTGYGLMRDMALPIVSGLA